MNRENKGLSSGFDLDLEKKVMLMRDRLKRSGTLENVQELLWNLQNTHFPGVDDYRIGNLRMGRNVYEKDEIILIYGYHNVNKDFIDISVHLKNILGKKVLHLIKPSCEHDDYPEYLIPETNIRFPRINDLILRSYFPGNWESYLNGIKSLDFAKIVKKDLERIRRAKTNDSFSSFFG